MDGLWSFRYAWRGLALLSRAGVRRYVVLPLLLNFTLFALLIWGGAHYFDALLGWLLPARDQVWWLLYWLLWGLFALTAWFILFYAFTLVANLVAAPFNGLLAEAVEFHLTGHAPPGGVWQALKTLGPSFMAELRKLLYLGAWSLPLLLLAVIPGVNVVAPLAWALFGAWMLGLQYLDYPYANHGIYFSEQRRRLGRQRLATLSFGAGVMVMTLTPLLNFLVMPAAVAGATALWVERLSKLTVETEHE